MVDALRPPLPDLGRRALEAAAAARLAAGCREIALEIALEIAISCGGAHCGRSRGPGGGVPWRDGARPGRGLAAGAVGRGPHHRLGACGPDRWRHGHRSRDSGAAGDASLWMRIEIPLLRSHPAMHPSGSLSVRVGIPLELEGFGIPLDLEGFGIPLDLEGFGIPLELEGFGIPLELEGFGIPVPIPEGHTRRGRRSPRTQWPLALLLAPCLLLFLLLLFLLLALLLAALLLLLLLLRQLRFLLLALLWACTGSSGQI